MDEKTLEYHRQWRQSHKESVRAASSNWRKRNPNYHKERYQYTRDAECQYGRDRNRHLKAQFFDMYGQVCACCGESRKEFLTLEHKHGKSKRSEAGKNAYVKAVREYRPDLYEVLCMNCNFSKGRFGYCPHQTEKKNVTSEVAMDANAQIH